MGKHCTVNMLSVNSTGFIVGDMGIHNAAKDVTFRVRFVVCFHGDA